MGLIKLIEKIDSLSAKVESFFLSSVLITMVILAAVQVVLRNLSSFTNWLIEKNVLAISWAQTFTPIEWADVFNRHLVLWIGFLGATLATKENKHIKIDALNNFIAGILKKLAHLIVIIFTGVIAYLLFDSAYTFMIDERSYESIIFRIGEFPIPTWWLISIMPLGFFIITIRSGINLLTGIRDLFVKESAS